MQIYVITFQSCNYFLLFFIKIFHQVIDFFFKIKNLITIFLTIIFRFFHKMLIIKLLYIKIKMIFNQKIPKFW